MPCLPAIAPRLVIRADDVAELLAELADERASLETELDVLVRSLEAATAELDGTAVDDGLARTATAAAHELCAGRRVAAMQELEARIAASERLAAETVGAAEAEVATLLATVRAEVGDRLVGEVAPVASPSVAAPLVAADVPAATEVAPAPGGGSPVLEVPPAPAELEAASASGWDEQDADSERFRAFWSEHDEVASVRDAIAVPLVAIAPMAIALLVIVLVLMLLV